MMPSSPEYDSAIEALLSRAFGDTWWDPRLADVDWLVANCSWNSRDWWKAPYAAGVHLCFGYENEESAQVLIDRLRQYRNWIEDSERAERFSPNRQEWYRFVARFAVGAALLASKQYEDGVSVLEKIALWRQDLPPDTVQTFERLWKSAPVSAGLLAVNATVYGYLSMGRDARAVQFLSYLRSTPELFESVVIAANWVIKGLREPSFQATPDNCYLVVSLIYELAMATPSRIRPDDPADLAFATSSSWWSWHLGSFLGAWFMELGSVDTLVGYLIEHGEQENPAKTSVTVSLALEAQGLRESLDRASGFYKTAWGGIDAELLGSSAGPAERLAPSSIEHLAARLGLAHAIREMRDTEASSESADLNPLAPSPGETQLQRIALEQVALRRAQERIAERQERTNDMMIDLFRSLRETHSSRDERILVSSVTVQDMIAAGESAKVEFKASLRWDWRDSKTNIGLERVVLKTIVAFLNTDGGTLLIGVDNSKQVVGLEKDYKTLANPGRDSYELHLTHLVSGRIGKGHCVSMAVTFHEIEGKDVCMLRIEPSSTPAYITGGEHEFYIRTGNQSQPLGMKESHEYLRKHWSL